MFGFDDDDESVFERSVESARKARLTMAMFAMLAPYPGTPLYDRLSREGRLSSPRWWLEAEHDALFPAYVPRRMTRERLREGWIQAWRDFYGLGSIIRRWRPRIGGGWLDNLAFLPLNAFMHRLAKNKIAGGHRFFVPR